VRLGFDFKIFHLLEREDYPFYVQTVFNAGSFLPLDTLIGGFDMRTMLEYGAGIGVLTNTPIGPFQLVFGVGDPGKAPNSTRFNVLVSVGRDFLYPQ
jgi:outer membrane translocation and assembly module TamA